MSKIPSKVTYFVIAAYNGDRSEPRWLCKSSRGGRGVWKIALDWHRAEQLASMKRVKVVLKSIGVKALEHKWGYRMVVLKVTASHQTTKVWPLAPLEALAQAADK